MILSTSPYPPIFKLSGRSEPCRFLGKRRLKNTGANCLRHILNVKCFYLFKFKNTGSKCLHHIKTLNVVNFLKLKLKLKNTGLKWLCHICQQHTDLLTRFPMQARVILFI